MQNNYAFFDVDSVEITPGTVRYNCPDRSEPISEYLFEIYGLISGINAPYLFTIHENGCKPTQEDKRDAVFVPINGDDKEWKKSAGLRYKYYLERGHSNEADDLMVFNSNKNASECIKAIDAKQWVVFGVGLENKVDHVITELINQKRRVAFIPELIINERANEDGEINEDELNSYFTKWELLGAKPMKYNHVMALIKKK